MEESLRNRIYRLIGTSKLRRKNIWYLCQVAGVRPGTVYSAMSDERRLSKKVASQLADALGVPLEEVQPDPAEYERRNPPEIPPERQEEVNGYMAAQQQERSICQECQNAVPDAEGHGCEWSMSKAQIPVPGWTAIPSKSHVAGWKVKECPKFIPDYER